MKKIFTLALLAAMLVTAFACSKDDPDTNDTVTTTNTTATTPAVTEDPEKAPVVITLEEVQSVIDAAKEEYANATEIKLSDDTVISAELKDPGITVKSIENGTATEEQMGNYAMYLVNIRKTVCDRLTTAFPVGNTVILDEGEEGSDLGDFIFLDPKSAGFDTAGELFAKMISENGKTEISADFIFIQNSVATFFDGETEDVTILCPTDEENAVLAAIAAKLNPDMLTEKVTETTAE